MMMMMMLMMMMMKKMMRFIDTAEAADEKPRGSGRGRRYQKKKEGRDVQANRGQDRK